MGLIYLSLNNHYRVDNIINNKEGAEQYYNKFLHIMEEFKNLAGNECMLTIIDTMSNQLDELLINGQLEKGTFKYTQLYSLLEQVNVIQQKPIKSNDDTVGFYNTYNNFKDIKKRICGDQSAR